MTYSALCTSTIYCVKYDGELAAYFTLSMSNVQSKNLLDRDKIENI
jgi:hypothetical protein